MSFKPYPKYKDSGVEWLGKVPEHWEVRRSKVLFRQIREPSQDGDEQLSSTQKYGVIPQKMFMALEDQKVALALSGLSGFKRLREGDFVISLRSFQGGIERSEYSGCVSPAYTVLRPSAIVGGKYFAYLLKTDGYIQSLQTMTDGIRDGKTISYDQFGATGVVCPSLEEQSSISSFLDHETSKIDSLIKEQEKLIELLKEKRSAVISHAVTKGLDQNVKMKDSGVEWLGKVPEHWRVGKCGFYLSILSGFAFPSSGFSHDDNDTKLLRGINVGVSRLKWDETVYWKREPNDGLDSFELRDGDLVVGMDRPLIADGLRVAKVTEADLPCLLLQRVALLKTGNQLHVDYLFRLISSGSFVAHFSPDTTGVSVPHISPDQIKNFVVPVPPVNEQKGISEYIDSESRKIDSLIKEAESVINLLQERRSALISAAVTGQIHVRDFVPSKAA